MPTLSLPLTAEEYDMAARVRREYEARMDTDVSWVEFFVALVNDTSAAWRKA